MRRGLQLTLVASLLLVSPQTAAQNATLIDQVAGAALDFDGRRILFHAMGTASIKDHADGTVNGYGPIVGAQPRGHLTTAGAVWNGGEQRGGVYAARPELGASFHGEGDWLVWWQGTDTAASIHRQHHESTNVAILASNLRYPVGPHVDSNGTAVFTDSTPSFEFHLHVVSRTGSDQVFTTNGVKGLAAGANVVHLRHATAPSRTPLLLTSPSGAVEELDPTSSSAWQQTLPFSDYRTSANGWVAFTKIVGDSKEFWTRSPTGTIARATIQTGALATQPRLTAVNDSGEIGYELGGKQFLSAAGQPAPLEIPRGALRFVDGTWYVLAGSDVFRVDRQSLPPSSSGSPAGPGMPVTPAPPPRQATDSCAAAAGDANAAITTLPLLVLMALARVLRRC